MAAVQIHYNTSAFKPQNPLFMTHDFYGFKLVNIALEDERKRAELCGKTIGIHDTLNNNCILYYDSLLKTTGIQLTMQAKIL